MQPALSSPMMLNSSHQLFLERFFMTIVLLHQNRNFVRIELIVLDFPTDIVKTTAVAQPSLGKRNAEINRQVGRFVG